MPDRLLAHLRPLAEEVVIDAGELHRGLLGALVPGQVAAEALDGEIQIEHEGAAQVVAGSVSTGLSTGAGWAAVSP